MAARKLQRSRSNKWLAGVCGGIGEYLGLDATVVRIIFLVFGLVGAGELAYLILWLVVPKAP
jgi:phage shock protein C